MKKEKVISSLFTTVVYGMGLFYGYQIGKVVGKTDAYNECADQLNKVLNKHDYGANAVIHDREEEA